MYTLPGTTIECHDSSARQVINSLFMAGGLVLSQVCTITGLETHMVQNWIKRGFVSPPIDKKYTKRQLCRIIIINMLKDVLPLPQIIQLISYVNGRLDDESDDIIDDNELYFYFVDLITQMDGDLASMEHVIESMLKDCGKKPNEMVRIKNALTIFANAYFSAECKKRALIQLISLQ